MEATDREDLGINLIAPISDNAGQRLVSHVNSGDIVFHYFLPVKAIVALSVATGQPYVSKLRWPDRKNSPEGDAYCIDLLNYVELEEPIKLSDFRTFDSEIRNLKKELVARFGGSIYFPFQLRKSVDPAQSYLSKFPSSLVDIFPQISDEILENVTPEFVHNIDVLSNVENKPKSPTNRRGGFGRHLDDKKKRAVEQYAMKIAREYLEVLGYECEDVSNQKSLGYDFRASKGDEIVGVEVKGSSITRVQIDLQVSEVEFARSSFGNIRSLLIVVDEIKCQGDSEPYITSGGIIRKWWDWKPNELALSPTQFRYTLPEKSS